MLAPTNPPDGSIHNEEELDDDELCELSECCDDCELIELSELLELELLELLDSVDDELLDELLSLLSESDEKLWVLKELALVLLLAELSLEDSEDPELEVSELDVLLLLLSAGHGLSSG